MVPMYPMEANSLPELLSAAGSGSVPLNEEVPGRTASTYWPAGK